MPKQPSLTIIMCVHNNASSIVPAIRSVLSQTFPNLELLIVDDCSTDNSVSKAQSFTNDPRVRLLSTKQNSGAAGAARNLGIDEALGEYIVFIDADDLLLPHACHNLYWNAKRHSCDIVTSQRLNIFTDGKNNVLHRSWIFMRSQTGSTLNQLPQLAYDTGVAAKLFKTKLLQDNKISFPEGTCFEDEPFYLSALRLSHITRIIPDHTYKWTAHMSPRTHILEKVKNDLLLFQERITSALTCLETVPEDSPDFYSALLRRVLRWDIWQTLDTLAADNSFSLPEQTSRTLQTIVLLGSPKDFTTMPLDVRLKLAGLLSEDEETLRDVHEMMRTSDYGVQLNRYASRWLRSTGEYSDIRTIIDPNNELTARSTII